MDDEWECNAPIMDLTTEDALREDRAWIRRQYDEILEAIEVHVPLEALLDAVLRTRSAEEIGQLLLAAWDRAEAQRKDDEQDAIAACIVPLEYEAQS
jgi:hypothetical protein